MRRRETHCPRTSVLSRLRVLQRAAENQFNFAFNVYTNFYPSSIFISTVYTECIDVRNAIDALDMNYGYKHEDDDNDDRSISQSYTCISSYIQTHHHIQQGGTVIISVCLFVNRTVTVYTKRSVVHKNKKLKHNMKFKQEALLLQRNRATRYVS